jgi:hypothetical protein
VLAFIPFENTKRFRSKSLPMAINCQTLASVHCARAIHPSLTRCGGRRASLLCFAVCVFCTHARAVLEISHNTNGSHLQQLHQLLL